MTTGIEELLPEVLAHIFDYLNVFDRISAARASPVFYSILNKEEYLNDVTLPFYDKSSFTEYIQHPMLSFNALEFHRCVIDTSAIILLEKLKPSLATLTFDCCHFTEKINLNTISSLLSLIVIEAIPDIVTSDIYLRPKLRKFCIKDGNLTCGHLANLCHKFPRLRELYILNCNFFGKASNRPMNFTWGFMRMRRSLKSLSFDSSNISAAALVAIARIPHLRLLWLSLAGCDDCICVLPEILSYQESLISLNLRRVPLDDFEIQVLCKYAPHLKELILNSCHEISETALAHIFRLEHLTNLNLSLRICHHFTRAFLSTFWDRPSKITQLSVTATDIDLETIFTYCPDIEELYLLYNSVLTDYSAYKVFQFKELKKLTMGPCHEIMTNDYRKALRSSCCPNLEVLDVSLCNVDGDFVCEFLNKYSNVEMIFVPHSVEVPKEKLRRSFDMRKITYNLSPFL